ncbi:hypothetical protein P3T37_003000 [Kitasatospora sp. MAA4]|uniref:hypothetical protein n=1 Tax=Kitasatospora sp. MAA4 TaxID=3035093 RepID=UPI002476735C|nr:hypothetical protein [Kitasatospora sp. MAA4]MDH6133604.1 hypothetical protein [Kitasatospora sp. MAA4]
MAVIAIVGGPGAPGATTTALALLLCWPLAPGRKVLLVECDPDGGAALAGALEGRVEAVYGLRNLAVADRRGLLAEALWEQLVDISPTGTGERLLLPGLTDPAQAAGLAYTWEPLVEALHALDARGYDVLLDLGRSGATGPSAVLARRADAVLVTLRSTLRGLSAARPRLAALSEDLAAAGTGADALGLLVITEGPYPAADITREFGLPVLGLLPHAARTAHVLSDGGDSTDRRFVRSELMRTARTAADRIQAVVQRRRTRLTATGAVPAAPAQVAGYGWGAPEEAHPLAYPAPPQVQVQQVPQVQQAPQVQQPYAAPSGQVYAPEPEQSWGAPYGEQPYAVPQTGPVRTGPVRPASPAAVVPQPAEPYPPLAGLAPHPAAPEQFRAQQDGPQQDNTQTQGAVLRAR